MDLLSNYIKNTKKSFFRFEGLQDYSAEDGDEWVKYFIETGKLKEYPDDTNEWWKNIKEMNHRGIVTQRVRLVTKPLTDYTKMELAYLKEAAQYSGEDIRIIEEQSFKKIAPSGLDDFYLIDDTYIFQMEYGVKGKYMGSRLIEGSDVRKYIEFKENLLKNSYEI